MSILKAGRPSRKEKAISDVQNLQDETIRMNINIPKTFYKKIKQKALDDDMTVTELVIKALKTHIIK